MKVVLATHNLKKVAEMEKMLSQILKGEKILTPQDAGIFDEPEENGATFEENALIKARSVWEKGRMTIADDSGLCVNSLGGEPGIYSARYAGEHGGDEANNKKLLEKLLGASDRSAYFVCAIACVMPDGDSFTVRGVADGYILEHFMGEGGFGYDPLFFYPSASKTFAQFTPDEKNEVSHRGKAMRMLKDELNKRIFDGAL